MGTRPLSPDEAALWARVMAGVRPLTGHRPPLATAEKGAIQKPLVSSKVELLPRPGVGLLAVKPAPDPASRPRSKRTDGRVGSGPTVPSNTLDGTWDRQLSRGLVSPDRTIDLHGHTLHSAHDLLDAALDAAIRSGNRMILLITGKPPRPASERPHARGAIRAATGDWLAGVAPRRLDRGGPRRASAPRRGRGAVYRVAKTACANRAFAPAFTKVLTFRWHGPVQTRARRSAAGSRVTSQWTR